MRSPVSRLWHIVPLRLRSLLFGARLDREHAEELQLHHDQLVEQFLARGMSPDAAQREATIAMGGLTRRREEMHDAHGLRAVENVIRDARHAVRSLLRTPGFALINVLTLALGIGANLAIFSVLQTVLLRPLDYGGDPERLVFVSAERMETTAPAYAISWRARSTSVFSAMGAASFWSPTLAGDRPEQVDALRIEPQLLSMLAVPPMLGRHFLPSDARPGSAPVTLLSHAVWRDRYGGDSAIIGRTVSLDGIPHTVVGVMPPRFRFAPFWATGAKLWTPLSLEGREGDRETAAYRVFAQLRPGVSVAQAQAAMSAIGAQEKAEHVAADAALRVVALRERVTGDVREAIWILFGAVSLVLLIACANVTHLQLMRAVARERETALRVSLGATRWRVAQQSLAMSGVLAVAGGLLGMLVCWACVQGLVRLAPPSLPRIDTVRVDPSLFLVMLAVTTLVTLAAGTAPALLATRAARPAALGDGSRGAGESRARRRMSTTLVASEFALAVLLLVGAGLVLRSHAAMLAIDPGFDPRGVVAMTLSTRGTSHGEPVRRAQFHDAVLNAVRREPGVMSASAVNHLPLHGDDWRFSVFVEGRPLPSPGNEPRAVFRVALPGYVETMGMSLVGGRSFLESDSRQRAQVVLVDEHFARAHWPGESAIGKRISVRSPADGADWYTVVGILRDSRQVAWLGEAEPVFYFPFHVPGAVPPSAGAPPGVAAANAAPTSAMLTPGSMTLVVRASGDAARITERVRAIVHAVDVDAPVSDVITMDDAIAEQFATPRFYLALLGGFAVVALTLAAVGIYGVVSYDATRRTREIGIRLALGADPHDPFWRVFRDGLRSAATGLLIGTVAAFALSRYLRSLLYGVGSSDPVTFGCVVAILLVAASAACAVPALRASRLDPAAVLRGE